MTRRAILSILGVVGILILCGCRHSIRIQTVDLETGDPIVGVATEWRQHRHQITGPIVHSGPRDLEPSDVEGLIEVDGKYRNWLSQFVFTHPDYSALYAQYGTGDKMRVSRQVSYRTGMFEGEFHLEGEPKTVVRDDRLFVLRMTRK